MGLASVLLVLSPFTQINTPYPSTAYLKGYLEAKGVRAGQADLGIETILTLFSTQGLGELFAEIERRKGKYPAKVRGMLANKQRYIDTITAVVAFLQGKNDPLAYRICNQDYLPESDRRSQNEEELEWAFGTSGLRDKARYLATLYLEDLCDLIRETIDPDFGFSRYRGSPPKTFRLYRPPDATAIGKAHRREQAQGDRFQRTFPGEFIQFPPARPMATAGTSRYPDPYGRRFREYGTSLHHGYPLLQIHRLPLAG